MGDERSSWVARTSPQPCPHERSPQWSTAECHYATVNIIDLIKSTHALAHEKDVSLRGGASDLNDFIHDCWRAGEDVAVKEDGKMVEGRDEKHRELVQAEGGLGLNACTAPSTSWLINK